MVAPFYSQELPSEQHTSDCLKLEQPHCTCLGYWGLDALSDHVRSNELTVMRNAALAGRAMRRSRLTFALITLVGIIWVVYAVLSYLVVGTKRQWIVEDRSVEGRLANPLPQPADALNSKYQWNAQSVHVASKIRVPVAPSSTPPVPLPPAVDNLTVQTDDDDRAADTGMETVDSPTRRRTRRDSVEYRVGLEVRRLRLRAPRNPQYTHGSWQSVDDSRQVYLLSAFFDDRPDIDWPQVRLIGVAEADVVQYELCCLLWYSSQRLPDVAEVLTASIGPKISPRGRALLEQFMFSCRVDRNKTVAPASVSVISSRSYHPTNLITVQLPEKPGSPAEVLDIGHCMSILYWRQDAFRLVEWLEAHRMWGVAEVNVYATRVDNITDAILQRYAAADDAFVKYFPFTGPLGDDDDDDEHSILLSMSPVINDCMYRNLYRYRYVISTDIDELIVPERPHHNYSEMLSAAAAEAIDPQSLVHSYIFRNAYFFLDFGATHNEPWYLLTQRYTKRVRPSRYGYSAKSFTRTLSCYGLQNHLCWQRLPAYSDQPNWHLDVPTDIGKSHHYKKCHFDRYLRRHGVCHRLMSADSVTTDRAALSFHDELVSRVVSKLLELDLVEPVTQDDSNS